MNNFLEFPQFQTALETVNRETEPNPKRSLQIMMNFFESGKMPYGHIIDLNNPIIDDLKTKLDENPESFEKNLWSIIHNQDIIPESNLFPKTFQPKLTDFLRVLRANEVVYEDNKKTSQQIIINRALVSLLIVSSVNIILSNDERLIFVKNSVSAFVISFEVFKSIKWRLEFESVHKHCYRNILNATATQTFFEILPQLQNPESTASKILANVQSKEQDDLR